MQIIERIVQTFHTSGPDIGKFRGASVSRLEVVGDKQYEAGVLPATEQELATLAVGINAGIVSQRDALQVELDQAKEDLATANALAEQVTNLTSQVATLTSEKETLTASVAALNQRVEQLLTELPFNPRSIDAAAFYERISKDEFAMLSASDDETLRTIAKTILAYKTNDWPVVFESQQLQDMLGYLVGSGFLTQERANELTTDATRAEAYDAE